MSDLTWYKMVETEDISYGFDLENMDPARFKILLYLALHPEGKQKSDIAKDLPISRNKSLALQKTLFEKNLIETTPSFDKHLFQLTEDGESVVLLIKSLDVYMRKASDKNYIATDDEMVNFKDLKKNLENFLKKQKTLRSTAKMKGLLN